MSICPPNGLIYFVRACISLELAYTQHRLKQFGQNKKQYHTAQHKRAIHGTLTFNTPKSAFQIKRDYIQNTPTNKKGTTTEDYMDFAPESLSDTKATLLLYSVHRFGFNTSIYKLILYLQ